MFLWLKKIHGTLEAATFRIKRIHRIRIKHHFGRITGSQATKAFYLRRWEHSEVDVGADEFMDRRVSGLCFAMWDGREKGPGVVNGGGEGHDDLYMGWPMVV